jgi:hypothetical protein
MGARMTSMTDTASTPAATPLSLPARVVGVLFSPRETFANVAQFPRWLGVMALSLVLFAGAQAGFLSTEVGRQAALDQQVAQMEGFGMTVSDAQYQKLQEQARYTPIIQGVAILVVSPILTAIIAGVLFGVFSGALGGQATYKQVYAILAHGTVLNIVQALVITPLNYFRGSLSSATSLGVFFPMLDEGSFLANLVGAIDFFVLWSIALMSIGLAVLYRRKTGSVFTSLVAVYAVIAIAIAAVKAALGGS